MRKLKCLFPLMGFCLIATSCSSTSAWKSDASQIYIHGIDLEIIYIKDNYYILDYIEKDFKGIDIRFKVNKEDEYVITYYRNVTYVLEIISNK